MLCWITEKKSCSDCTGLFTDDKALFFKTQYLLKCLEVCSPRALMFLRSSVKEKQGRRSCVSFCSKSVRCEELREHQEQDCSQGRWLQSHQLHRQFGSFRHFGAVHGISIRYWSSVCDLTQHRSQVTAEPVLAGAALLAAVTALHPALTAAWKSCTFTASTAWSSREM